VTTDFPVGFDCETLAVSPPGASRMVMAAQGGSTEGRINLCQLPTPANP
jgi:hypothetical protein